MNKIFKLFLIILLNKSFVLSVNKKNFDIVFNKLIYDLNPEVTTNGFAKIEDNKFFMEYTLSKTLNNVYVEVELSMGTPLVQLFNKSRNICNFFKKPFRDPIFNIAVKDILKSSNYSKCPVEKVFFLHCVTYIFFVFVIKINFSGLLSNE